MLKITYDELHDYYHNKKLNPHEIAEILDCDHKTVRSHLKKNNIKLRTPAEYTFLPVKNFTLPTDEKLFTKASVIGHTMYICEGWHTASTDSLSFCNQDINLVRIFSNCVIQTYDYTGNVNVTIAYNKDCDKSIKTADDYEECLRHSNVNFNKIYRASDSSRKNPIMRVRVGGKNLSRAFIENAYRILNSI